jgi:hypothetical protein
VEAGPGSPILADQDETGIKKLKTIYKNTKSVLNQIKVQIGLK